MVLDLRRKFSALLVALLVFSCFAPGMACADTLISEVVYSTDTYTERNSIVVSDSAYNAASLVMGKNAVLLTDEQKSYLSDPAFCPNFVDYASTFVGIDANSIPDWVPAYMVPIVLDRMLGASTWGGGYVYASTASNFQYELAESEFNSILNGDYPSGGGSDAPVAGNYTMNFTVEDLHNRGNNYSDSVDPSTVSPSVSFGLTQAQVESFQDVDYITGVLYSYSGSSTRTHWLIVYGGNSQPSISMPGYVSTNVSTSYVSGLNLRYSLEGYSGNAQYLGSAQRSYQFNIGWVKTWSVDEFFTGSPGGPGGDWPEGPQIPSPTPPHLPEIDDNPVPSEPTETDISVNLPVINVSVGGSATDLSDVISILKVINGNLVTINDNLEDEFNSVISAFRAIGGQLEQLAQRIREHCQHIRTSIYQNTTHLEREIYKLFHWLASEMDFAFTSYDDTSLLSYLRRILNKLSNPSRPDYQPNPIADEENFFDWLLDLWHRFLIDLASILPESMLGLLDLFSQLTHYFPISIPWDIAAMLALFVHDPVIPVFDLPMPFAVGQTASIHIDLTPWDGVAQMVRPVFLVMFCFALAMETKKLLSHVNVTEGGI